MLLLAIVAACAGLACWQSCGGDPVQYVSPTTRASLSVPESQPATQAASRPMSRDDRLAEMALGVWTDNYKGKRTMRLLADGTATMHVELSGFNAILGSKMRFDMLWSVKDGRLKKRTIGGEPSGRVNMILKMMGDRVDEPILKLTEQRMILLDKDEKTQYDWRRVNE